MDPVSLISILESMYVKQELKFVPHFIIFRQHLPVVIWYQPNDEIPTLVRKGRGLLSFHHWQEQDQEFSPIVDGTPVSFPLPDRVFA